MLEVPERYYCIRGGNVNYTLLNLDVNIIAQYCRKSRITSPNAITDLRSILGSLYQGSGAFSAYNFGRRAQADQVNKAYQSASYEARIPGLRQLWEMKGIEYPQFKNQSCFTGTCTVTGPKSDGTPSMLQWFAPSTVEEEREQLQLGLYHSTIDYQDSNMQQSAASQNPPETDQPKDTETNAVQRLLSLSGMQKPRTCWMFI